MATIFVSPGIFTKEQDFTVFASRIGITRLGAVGKTLKGPAFEPTKIGGTEDYALRFGATHPDYPLSYVANAFLAESNELTVTRILGETGFKNSPAWIIVANEQNKFKGDVVQSGVKFEISGLSASTTFNFVASASTSMAANTVSSSTSGNTTYIIFSGNVSSVDVVSALSNDIVYSSIGMSTTVVNPATTFTAGTWSLSASTLEDKGSKSGSTLAVIRSKRKQVPNVNGTYDFFYNLQSDVVIEGAKEELGTFVIKTSTGSASGGTRVSLDETSDDYIVKILGKTPAGGDGSANIYVERIYPHFIRQASALNEIKYLEPNMVFSSDNSYTDFEGKYTNAVTPWIVSRVIGGDVKNLFQFETISDGDSSNREIKISIANIDINNYTFDVIIRRFEDTDATAAPSAYERWSNLSLKEGESNYIARVIGTTDEDYPRKSNFVTVNMASNFPTKTVPSGFRGYELRSYKPGASADIYYKTDYLSGDSVFKTYLGISELGYTELTSNRVSTRSSVKGVEVDLFSYDGGVSTGKTLTKGFHLENTANQSEFSTGSKSTVNEYVTNSSNPLVDRGQLKFTLVPAGGFDGWDKYQEYSELYEEFTPAYVDNVKSFKKGLDHMANSEVVDINILSTPGINFRDNEDIIKYALDIVEERTDTIYVIDSPRLTRGSEKGTPIEVVSILEASGIDSNYAATYWPWIQVEDPTTGRYTYQAPTMMAIQAYAYTDNKNAPWYAPAGITRGTGGPNIVRADVRLDKPDRDVLYQGRINPIATLVQHGVVIWGQKTLQVRQSSLDRINIRRLLLQVRRLVSAASLVLLFEQNDQTLRDQFLAKVEPILLKIQNQRGLSAFKVIMDSSNNTSDTIDRNVLIGKIQLQPTKTAEFISLDFQVLPTGANFSDF